MRLEQEKTITVLLTNDPALQPLEGSCCAPTPCCGRRSPAAESSWSAATAAARRTARTSWAS